MIIKRPGDIPSSEITPEGVYVNRRQFIAKAGAIGAGVVASSGLIAACGNGGVQTYTAGGEVEAQGEKPNSYEEITTYNNFYEFGYDKEDPSNPDLNGKFRPRPWTVRVEGLVKKPADYDFDDLVKLANVEDRTYRMRCVEGWSMVIPWQGIQLSRLINRLEPLPGAKYVEFATVVRPSEMPGQRGNGLDWPYIEGLRMDEAMHPLTIMATGIYGKPLLTQNGAPIRLVVPWKYGFKGIKSIVRIRFTEEQPKNTWQIENPREYGFYANVNPTVDHPRWTQASERRIGQFRRIETRMFNGYADQVASMYAGMDLRKNF
ncbi:MAG TPA: protein-methionine-sulfoxide reductase catalytic subunit MsrP [Gemmatimonadaceae bacterium]|nr:protein-methionine-sulfoxide reductase catalytic subunit MsrP [Gemmatimonadaceae bacterium]